MSTQTVFVIDSDAAASGLVVALVKSSEVRAEAFPSVDLFLRSYNLGQSGCIVADARMLGVNGSILQARLANAEIDLPVIFTTPYADVELAVRLMKLGAMTVLEKPWREFEMWENIHRALALDRENRPIREHQRNIRLRIDRLTYDEREVMDQIVVGKPNKAIAHALHLGLRTVEARRRAVFEKLEADSLVELVMQAIEVGCICPEDLHSHPQESTVDRRNDGRSSAPTSAQPKSMHPVEG